ILVSRLAGAIAQCRTAGVKNALIDAFVRRFEVDMSEALVEDPHAYEHFNAFFTRALKPGSRPVDRTPGSVVSPADGAISQLGAIDRDAIFQAKGHRFGVVDLLGGEPARAAPFLDGHFATIYLSPRDYHRVHMPV